MQGYNFSPKINVCSCFTARPTYLPNEVIPLPTDSAPVRNRLALEKSPYLLQHATNPVDWFPWSDEAFALAKAENKPIFLSIGYSTCHWCHVMERETFEDSSVGDYLRLHFVSIKVDREERPDIDKIHMTFLQMTTGAGGWPLNAFLTPNLQPFYAGTYFAPQEKQGNPSFLGVLKRIVELWSTRQNDIVDSATDLTEKMKSLSAQDPDNAFPTGFRELQGGGQSFLAEYDSIYGGFGGAPKFPRPSLPLFLLRYGRRFAENEATTAVLYTCQRMAAGGLYDHLRGGFARYSVDECWLVPHFEKMLYDNAQLVQLYLEAFLISGENHPATVVRDVLSYVLTDMTHSEGGFFSAEDADSEGKEGKFCCWTHAELASLLTPEEFNVTTHYFGITKEGNFIDPSDPDPLLGQNVLSIAQADLPEADAPLLKSAITKMREVRATRPRPHLDDKILTSWNGMMLGAFARAFAILGDESFLATAESNLKFIRAKLWTEPNQDQRGTLGHSWREGQCNSVQILDSYASLLAGVIDLYEATLVPNHLEFAVDLAEAMIHRFYDTDAGGFWQSGSETPHLLMRVKEDYDSAEPSGNSVACLALLRLASICDRADWRGIAEKTLRLFAQKLHQTPQSVPHLLMALDFAMQEPKRVVIAGDWLCGSTRALLNHAHRVFEPNRIILGNHGPVARSAQLLPTNEEFAIAYLCTGTECQAPTRDRSLIQEFLKQTPQWD